MFHTQVPVQLWSKCLDSGPSGPHGPSSPVTMVLCAARCGVEGRCGMSRWGGTPLWKHDAEALRSHNCVLTADGGSEFLFQFREDTWGPGHREWPTERGRAALTARSRGPSVAERSLLCTGGSCCHQGPLAPNLGCGEAPFQAITSPPAPSSIPLMWKSPPGSEVMGLSVGFRSPLI